MKSRDQMVLSTTNFSRAQTSILFIIAALMMSTTAWAQGITGSAHDFSTDTSFNNTGEICKVCHLPHNSLSPTSGPLWNRTMSAVTTYSTYTSTNKPGSFLDNTMGQPEGVSKLCLSCHDGTVALDAFGGSGMTGGGNIETLFNANRNIGDAALGDSTADLSNDHPVSFELVDGSDDKIFTLATIKAAGLEFFGSGVNRLECATCHDVHDDDGNSFLLRVKNTTNDAGGLASGLCLTCHDK